MNDVKVNFNPPKLSQHDELTVRRIFSENFMVLRFTARGDTDVYQFVDIRANDDLIDSLKRFIVSIITVPGLLYTHEDITCGDSAYAEQREADIMHAYGVIERWSRADASATPSPPAKSPSQANDETTSLRSLLSPSQASPPAKSPTRTNDSSRRMNAHELEMALTNVIYQSDMPGEMQIHLQHVIHQWLGNAAYDAAIASIDPRWR